MKLEVAGRLNGIGEYYFSQKLRQIDDLNKSGANVINLGIGSPDMPPHPEVIKTLQEEASKPAVHGYQNYKGIPAFRQAIAAWYQKWYSVDLDANSEILPLIGSKEGIMHISMTFLNEGDEVLIPNPGYPTYKSATELAGGVCINYDLLESNEWQPDFQALESRDLSKVKIMWVNYPHMPTGQPANFELFKRLVKFGVDNNILVCHDNPYSFILNNIPPISLLSVPGSKEVVIELNSLSKSHNMAGWRIGMIVASAQNIEKILRFKSNMDSGMFQPIQMAAAKALTLGEDWHDQLNKVYAVRRERVYELLDTLNCIYDREQVGLFVWARIPADFENGFQLSDQVLNDARVFITPGGIFG
ncbi:MAG TPA: aminotransferase class I/II-fold pyridoxal phosphate-dependent enzyme, partial [Flavisolibacter sp.]|nr:aminotransferase class I/II-fold pyridoxal phosphate-dependent enzyme [Flavisolibacter sp.]